jgi:ABC-type Fe3+ transport system substrate-binding protein
MKSSMVSAISIVILFLFLVAPRQGSAQANWQKEWETMLAGAEKEGQVNIAGPAGDIFRQVLVDDFRAVYPKIKVEYLGGPGRDKVARILREREAGIYGWDLYIGGANSALTAFKPVKGLDSFRPTLILPEIIQDKYWIGGFKGGWADDEKRIYYTFGGGLTSDTIHINWDQVPRGAIKAPPDLLDPKWAGKIVMQDPRLRGKGLSDAMVMMVAYGEDFIKRLFQEQKIVYAADQRQMVEWVVRGKYPIGMGLVESFLVVFREKGLGKNVSALQDPATARFWTSGNSGIGLFDRSPHPNATKLLVNWLLSRKGQIDWLKTANNSRRVDVPPQDPNTALHTGANYHVMAEYSLRDLERMQKLSTELIR